MKDLKKKLKISDKALNAVNDFLLDVSNPLISILLELLDKYGGIEEINRKAEEAGRVENLMQKLETLNPNYIEDLEWLINQRDNNAFISIPGYRKAYRHQPASLQRSAPISYLYHSRA